MDQGVRGIELIPNLVPKAYLYGSFHLPGPMINGPHQATSHDMVRDVVT